MMLRMTARLPARPRANHLLLLLLAPVLGAAVTAVPAAAAGPVAAPTCVSTAQPKVRPGVERGLFANCTGATSIEIVNGPAHGELSRTYTRDYGIGFLYRPATGATEDEEVVLRATGSGGTATVPVTIDVVPASENTPPYCFGEPAHQRSSGTEPVVVRLSISCGDAENDDFTLHGGGPGEHLVAPQRWSTFNVTAGWTYRTSIAAGTESTTVWAVDDLGARSADVRYDVEVGPQVDVTPVCRTENHESSGEPVTVLTRPGRPRRMALECWDTDGDPVDARIVTAPEHGTLVIERDGPRKYSQPGHSIEVLYTPTDDAASDGDRFTLGVGATELPVELRPVDADRTGHISCINAFGLAWANTETGKPLTLDARCFHTLGDPITATIAKAPARASLTPPTTEPEGYGVEDIATTFTSDVWGTEEITVELSSPSAPYPVPLNWTIVTTTAWAPGGPPSWVRPAPGGKTGAPGPGGPVSGAGPDAPAGQTKRAAQRLLGTKDVLAVKRTAGAVVYVDRKAWKRGLAAAGAKPALAITCSRGCDVDSSARLELGGSAKAKGSSVRRLARQRGAARGAKAFAVRLRPGRADLARLRRAHTARAAFELTISAPGATGKATLRAKLRR